MSGPTGPADFQPMTESNYPTLDFPRECYTVLHDYGLIEPYTEENDSCVAMPVRWAQDQGGEFCIELGPYTLYSDEIRVLLEAIGDWYEYARKSKVHHAAVEAEKAEKAKEDRKVTRLGDWLKKRGGRRGR